MFILSDYSLNLIGWRGKGVKKVIIVITDQEMHFALDGILGGIVRPFDMKCHSTAEDGYTKQLELDYPSFGEVKIKFCLFYRVHSSI